jgi:methenyltetrahydromethanopterin cyclohydrolase
MLVRAAAQANLNTIVIDCFADSDTQRLSTRCYRVKSLAIEDIQSVVNSIKDDCCFCIYGSGFEAHAESLTFLETQFQLMGNSATTFKALQNKHHFFQRLTQLNIPFPAVLFPSKNSDLLTTNSARDYLIKPFNSLGGMNINKINTTETYDLNASAYYYQQYIDGQSLSVLFVANGKQAVIIGFNQQWTRPDSFVFAGIINHPTVSITYQQKLHHWINQLTNYYGLVGLGSLDFMIDEHQCYVLEINPRPSASMLLYQHDLLAIHGLACQGQLNTAMIFQPEMYSAYQIIYAVSKIKIPDNMQWPVYCCSLPPAKTIINPQQPICSMIVSGTDPNYLLEDLQRKQTLLFTQLSETL